MEEATERAVERAIAVMRKNLGEPLTVDDMARAAIFSKFHFTRIFQQVTGVSPGRFLSALRLQEARRLLISTSLNVSEICMRVGYSSVGTFSARFSRSVGLSPTEYRRTCGRARQVELTAGRNAVGVASGVVTGRVIAWPQRRPHPILMGLFPSRLPEGYPTHCAILDDPGTYRLEGVPAGAWYLLAQSGGADGATTAFLDQHLSVAAHGPIAVNENTVVEVDLRLERVRTLDPPVLLALHETRRSVRDRVVPVASGWRDRPAA